jgi:pimeloyl-ACP methyl ester carboxylesterase
MGDHGTRHYVLVSGSWHGGWVWHEVAARLRAAGHEVTTPTLTGLGERRHLGQGVDLALHVEDVVAHIEMERLSGVTLVGWSYGGMVITGALARIPERIRAMIYLDAFVPEDGKALVDYLTPEGRAAWDKFKDADAPLPPLSAERLGLTDPAQIESVVPRLTAQAWQSFYQPVRALTPRPAIPTAYIKCTDNPAPHFKAILEEMKRDTAVRTDAIDTGHCCMVIEPAETARMLETYGA